MPPSESLSIVDPMMEPSPSPFPPPFLSPSPSPSPSPSSIPLDISPSPSPCPTPILFPSLSSLPFPIPLEILDSHSLHQVERIILSLADSSSDSFTQNHNDENDETDNHSDVISSPSPSPPSSSSSYPHLGLIISSPSHLITHVNSAFSSITGYSLSDSLGKKCNFLQGKNTSFHAVEKIRSALSTRQMIHISILNYRKNGTPFWNELIITPIMSKMNKEKVELYVGITKCHSLLYVDKPLDMLKWNANFNKIYNYHVAQQFSLENRWMEQRDEREAGEEIRKWKINMGNRTQNQKQLGLSLPSSSSPSPSPSPSSFPSDVPLYDDNELFRIPPKPQQIFTTTGRGEAEEHKISSLSSSSAPFSSLSSPPSPITAVIPLLHSSTPVSFIAESPLPTLYGHLRVRIYKDLSPIGLSQNREIVVTMSGNMKDRVDLPCRVHDQCFTSEVLGSLKCDCREQLQYALNFIQNNRKNEEFPHDSECIGGVVIYLSQEGRGIGLGNKIKVYQLQQEKGLDTVDANRVLGFPDDIREYGCVPAILEDLGVKSIQLMTNNPRKAFQLTSLGVNISGRIPIVIPSNSHSELYLHTKQTKMEHQKGGENHF